MARLAASVRAAVDPSGSASGFAGLGIHVGGGFRDFPRMQMAYLVDGLPERRASRTGPIDWVSAGLAGDGCERVSGKSARWFDCTRERRTTPPRRRTP